MKPQPRIVIRRPIKRPPVTDLSEHAAAIALGVAAFAVVIILSNQ